MISGATAADGVFLQRAEGRRRLPGVEHNDASCGGVHVAARLGRNTAQALQKVERSSFCGEQRPRRSNHLGNRQSVWTMLPVAAVASKTDIAVALTERLRGDVEAGD